jgi:very-short-patch-repair endonuclease
MTRISPDTRKIAQRLRRDMTPQERSLWRELRELNFRIRTRFRRQAPVGPFIADFADLGRRLVIEVDGGQHHGVADQQRDRWLAAQGFLVLRFWNNDVQANLKGVMSRVIDAVEAAPPPHPSPTGGEGGVHVRSAALLATPAASPPLRGEGQGVGGTPRERRTP